MNVLAHEPGLALADNWQRDFPLSPQPFASIGRVHGLSEAETIGTLRHLVDKGVISRIGAVVRPHAAGASTLAAIAAPPERLAEIAAVISGEPYVNHNYEREHAINLWFVVVAPDQSELADTLHRIETRTGCNILDLRLERPFHIDLGFPLAGERAKHIGARAPTRTADAREKLLLAALDDGIPLVSRPYEKLASRIGWSGVAVGQAIAVMLQAGIISRFGCVLRHRALGFTANAMVVWDVADDVVDAVGARMATLPQVSLCYRRNRVLPDWHYNLFAMIHGRDESVVRQRISEIARESGVADEPRDVLFSRRCFKQRGARFSAVERRRSA